MNAKKITILIVVVLILAASGYFAYTKFIAKKAATIPEEVPPTEEEIQAEVEQKIAEVQEQKETALVESLDEASKKDAYLVAELILQDITGWNAHNMALYDKLNKSSNAYFFYFVTEAWKSVAKKELVKTLRSQKWSNLDHKSKKASWNQVKAEEVIASIAFRVENFNF